ncbi:PAS domain S-box protein [Niveibacterium sp.]|uniref:PAS domain S-box protein n=1 Tax=Niveibacterium sp. TaxID=2017444 RepID=UPI0035B4E35A
MSRRISLRRILSWQFAAAGLLPLLLVIVALLGYLLPSFERTLRARDKVLANAITEQVMSFLAAPTQGLDTAAAILRKAVPLNQISTMFDALAAARGQTGALMLVDYEGRVASVGLPERWQAYRDNFIGLSLGSQPYVRNALRENRPVWSETYLSPIGGQISVALAVPVDGQVLVAEVDVDRLSQSVAALRRGGNVLAVLVDRAGRVIAHPDSSKAREQVNLSDIDLVRKGLHGESATGRFMLDGREYIGSAVPIPALGWAALIGQPTDEVMGPLYAAAAITLAGLLLATGLLLFVGSRTAGRVANRLNLVAARGRAIADGKQPAALPPTRVSEFAQIGESLDTIFERLRAREGEVRAGAERLRTLLEGAPMGVVEVRVEPSGRLVVLGANPLVGRVLLVTEEATRGHSLQGAYTGFDNTVLEHACQRVAREGGSVALPGYEYIAPACERVLDLVVFRHHAGVVALCFHDMTERVAAERALRDSELRFSAAFMAVPDYVTLSRISDGTIYDANDAFERVTGIPRSRAIGRTSVELGVFVNPEQRHEVARQVLSEGRADRIPIEMRRADGGVSEGVVSARQVNIAGESCMVAVIRDESEVRRAQRALARLASAAGRNVLRSLLDAAVEGVGFSAVAALACVVADDAVELSGLRSADGDEVMGRLPAPALAAAVRSNQFAEWIPTAADAAAMAPLLGMQPHLLITAPIRADGGGAEALLVAVPHALEYPETARSLVRMVAERIGQEYARLRAEDNLRRSQKLFSQLFHASPVALSVSAVPGYAIQDCNEVWCRQFGYSLEEVMGHTGLELHLWAREAERAALLEDLAQRGESLGREAWMRRSDGGEILCAVSGRLMRDGERQLLILSLIDVTASRRNEQAVREMNATLEQRVGERTAQLTRANRDLSDALTRLEQAKDELVQSEKMAALGSIVAGVAHELNTPIGNCLTVTSTLSEATTTLVREAKTGLRRSTLHEYIETADQASDILLRNLSRAAELVASFKQVAVDRASSNRREFRVAEVMDETLLMLRPTLKLKPYRVDTVVEPDLVMDSFPGPLGQVLSNLVNNAIVHGFEGRNDGAVVIEAHADGADAVRITVRDDGVGISEAMQRRVFDPFFTTKLGRGGSGLGMHIVHTIVTGLLGGSVELQSSEGAGTSVTLVVPKRAPPQ